MRDESFPRDKDQLLREVDVRIRLGDIRRLYQLREALAPRWWEPTLVVILFASALGLLASLFQYSELRNEPINKWMLFWLGLMILTTVLCLQIILIRIYNFRRANDVLIHMVEDLRKQVGALEERVDGVTKIKSEPATRAGKNEPAG